MTQTKLFDYEKRMIKEFSEMKPIVCDIVIADKIKKLNEVENGRVL
ncbi:unnamed protein product [marine sediment metagenome]|uniref:Uncharacterized protein n=1 Tax=marine sediment metagenome TaxID=412755 RepID=X1UF62_9ZZZZ